MRMSYNIKTGLLTAIVGLAVLTSCGKKQQQQMPSAVYKTVKVSTQTIQLDTEYSATIRGRQDIDVYPQVGGTLQKLCVTEGQTVKKGDVIALVGSTGWSTGNHLHFTVYKNGVAVNPAPYIGL